MEAVDSKASLYLPNNFAHFWAPLWKNENKGLFPCFSHTHENKVLELRFHAYWKTLLLLWSGQS